MKIIFWRSFTFWENAGNYKRGNRKCCDKMGKLKSSNNSYSFPFNISYRKICKYTLDVKVLL